MVLVEICTDTLTDTIRAIQLGADRIELCYDLDTDGLTPSFDLFHDAIKLGKTHNVCIFPMIRCRAGNFVYTQDEKDLMIEQGRHFAEMGASGLVVGALSENNISIDIEFLKQFCDTVHAVNPAIEITFHKAFDAIKCPCSESMIPAADAVQKYCKRLLTSGGFTTAKDGANQIKMLVERKQPPVIIAAGGIRAQNVAEVIALTGVEEVHSRSAEICAALGKSERMV